MVAFACRGPNYNYDRIMQSAMWLFGISKIDHQSPQTCFNGLTIHQDMVKVPIAKLQPGALRYNGRSPNNGDLARGRWNLAGSKAVNPSPAVPWTVIELVRPGQRPSGKIGEFATAFHASLGNFGLVSFRAAFQHPKGPAKHNVGLKSSKGHFDSRCMSDDLEALSTVFRILRESSVRLTVVLLPDGDQELYSLVRRVGDVVSVLPSISVYEANLISPVLWSPHHLSHP